MSNYPPSDPNTPGGSGAPPRPGGWPSWLVYLASTLGGFYMLNPTAGLFELLPDNMPFVGNLDEAGAMMLVLWGVQEFRKRRRQSP